MAGVVALSNKSDTACQIKGIPVLQLLDAQGGVIPTQASDMCFPKSCSFIQPAILTPGSGEPQPHFPKPGQASFGIDWWLHTGAGTCEPPPSTAVSMQFTLPSGGGDISLSIDPVSRLSPCQGGIAVGPFTATEE